jgi:hypothetical protein
MLRASTRRGESSTDGETVRMTLMRAVFSDPGRLFLAIGLLCIAISLFFFFEASRKQYLAFRNLFFDQWPAQQSLAQEKAANPNLPVHTVSGYYQDTGLTSLDSTQMHYAYETDGVGVPKNLVIHNDVNSVDFEVAPIFAHDFRAVNGGVQIWQIRPKRFGLLAIGLATSQYRIALDGSRYDERQTIFAYKRIYVDPPLFSPTWFRVHFDLVLSLGAALFSLAAAVLAGVIVEFVKGAFGGT